MAAAIVLYAAQVAVGASQVLTGMPSGLRLAHLGLGAGFWVATVLVAASTQRQPGRPLAAGF